MARNENNIDRNDTYYTQFVPPDQRPGVQWLNNLTKTLVLGASALLAIKFASRHPSFFKHFMGNASELKNIPLVAEAKEILMFRRGVSAGTTSEFGKIVSSGFEENYVNIIDDMEALTLNDLVAAAKKEIMVKDIAYIEFQMQNASSFKIAKSEYQVLEEALKTGVLTENTRLGQGLYKDASGIYDMRKIQVDRWLASNVKEVSRVTRLPVLNFGLLDFTYTDLWADKPFFSGLELSKRGISASKPFYVGGNLYDMSTEEITQIGSNIKLMPTSGNLGYAYAQRAGIINEQLFGPRALHRHDSYNTMDYGDFEKHIYPTIVADPQRHLQEASEAWASRKDLPKHLDWLVRNNVGFLADYSPMYSKHEGWYTASQRVGKRLSDPEMIPILLDPIEFGKMSKLEQVKDSIIGLLGGETQHIKWVTRQEAIQLEKGLLDVSVIYRREGRKVGHSHAFLAGTYKSREVTGATSETGEGLYEATKTRVPKYFAYDPEEFSGFGIAMQYTAERIQRLPEAMFGFGIRPSDNWGKQFLRQLTHVALPVAAGIYGVNLVSDILGGVTGGYGDPRKAIAHTAAAAMLTKQAVLNLSGISFMSKHFEDIMPGSTDSLLAELSFFGTGAYAGTRIGHKFGRTKTGALLGLVVGAAFAIGDPSQKFSSLMDEMTGRKMVPVKKNRGWLLGRQDFKGDEIKYFKPNWYRRAIDQPEVKARYGSTLNYWLHGSLPGQLLQTALTPLGIGDNYWLEEKGPWAHTYPISNPLLQDIPFIGPMLEWGAGSIIKPYRYYVPDGTEWRPPYKFSESGLTPKEMRAIGIEPMIEQRSIPLHPFSLLNQIGNTLYNLEQYTGLIGWGTGMILGQFNQGEQLESFHALYGAPYRYYSKEIGGAFGMCIVEGSNVTTNNGHKKIEDIVIGDMVLSKDGTYKKVLHVFTRKTNDYKSIQVAGSSRRLLITKEHKVLAYKHNPYPNNIKKNKENIIEKIPVCELKKGDCLIHSQIRSKEDNNISIEKYFRDLDMTISGNVAYNKSYPNIRYNVNINITKELSYFLGWYLAKGHTTRKGSTVLGCHTKEKDTVVNVIKTAFDKIPHVYIDKNNCVITLYSTEISHLIAALCPGKAHAKSISSDLLNISKPNLSFLVKGLLEGNSNRTDKFGEYTFVSRELTLSLKDALAVLGITCSVNLDYIETSSEISCCPQGTKRKPILKNYLQYSKVQNRKLENIWETGIIPDFNPYRVIKEIETIYKCVNVYDIEVEDVHYYTAESYYISNSEYPRRFIPKGTSKLAYYNPLPYPYTMDETIPGSQSRYAEDRTYPIDLYYGGPTKIPYGEMRLPGPGSDYMYNTGNDTIDDYLRLSYLVPGSKAHKDMRTIVKTWIKSGVIDNQTARQLGWAQWSVSQKLERLKFDPLNYASDFTENDAFYADFTSRLFSDSTMSTNRLPKDPKARDAILSYNDTVTGNSYGSFGIPIFDSIIGSAWENLTHIDLPIPMIGTMLTRKLVHNKTALEEYEFTRIYSNSFASWDNWFTSIVTDTLFNLGDLLDLDIKPGRIQKESDLIEYMDSIKYLKYRQLEQQALLYRQPEIAAKLSEHYKQTIVGLDTTNPFDLMSSAFKAMPGPDKPFLKSFMFAPYSDRERILDEASPHMSSLLKKAWNFGRTKDYTDIMRRADVEASIIYNKYMRSQGPISSRVWHPSYDIKRERIRLARREALDIHRFGDWEMEEIRYDDGVSP